jgi:hypothetical protein
MIRHHPSPITFTHHRTKHYTTYFKEQSINTERTHPLTLDFKKLCVNSLIGLGIGDGDGDYFRLKYSTLKDGRQEEIGNRNNPPSRRFGGKKWQ